MTLLTIHHMVDGPEVLGLGMDKSRQVLLSLHIDDCESQAIDES